MGVSANAYGRHGVSNTPAYKIPKDVQTAIEREITRGRTLLMLRSSNWSK
jgi:hypothetical protein